MDISNAPLGKASDVGGLTDEALCVVCQEQVRSIALVPCGHLCVCATCVVALTRSGQHAAQHCPLCRGPIQSWLRVYR